MKQNETTENLRNRRTIEAIHTARINATEAIKRLDATNQFYSAHERDMAANIALASVKDYFMKLQPMIREREPALLKQYQLGRITFDSGETITVDGFLDFQQLKSPLTNQYEQTKTGLLGVREDKTTETAEIPETIIHAAYGRLDKFANDHDLLLSEDHERDQATY